MKLKNETFHIRLTEEDRKEIALYCSAHEGMSDTDFIRKAIQEKLSAEVKDAALIHASLIEIQNKLRRLKEDMEFQFSYARFERLYEMAYKQDIPADMAAAVSASRQERFDRFEADFKDFFRKNPSAFEALLADYFEGGSE